MTEDAKTEETSATRPQVIDLEAEEVKVEYEEPEALPPLSEDADEAPPAPMPPNSPPNTAPAKRTGSWRWAAAALVMGLIAGGWFYRDVLSAYLPTDEMTAINARVEALEANGKTVSEQLLSVSQATDAAVQNAAALSGAVAEAKSGLADVTSRAGSFESRLASAETTLTSAKSDLDALRNAVSASGAGTGTADQAALAAIGQRIEALEKDVASLKSGAGGGDSASLTAALSQALADLKAKVAAGTGFQSEYDRISRMVPAAAGLDVLAAHAAQGLPTAQGLADELRAAIPALPRPEAPASSSGDSYWDWVWNNLSGIVTIRDIGVTDWPLLAEKCAALAESGDITEAITLLDAAEGDKPPGITQWRDRAAARLRLEAAVAQAGEAVLRQIAALGAAP